MKKEWTGWKASLTDYCRATLEKASLQLDEIDAKRTAAPQPEADN